MEVCGQLHDTALTAENRGMGNGTYWPSFGTGTCCVKSVTYIPTLTCSPRWGCDTYRRLGMRSVTTNGLRNIVCQCIKYIKEPTYEWINVYYCSYFLGSWSGTESTSTEPFIVLLHQPYIIVGDDCGSIVGMNMLQGNGSTLGKPVPVTLSTTDPTLPDMVTNSGRSCGNRRLNAWTTKQPNQLTDKLTDWLTY
jgi:hypothetical protein